MSSTSPCARSRRDPPGHGGIRLPDDRRVSDQPRADARLRRSHQRHAGRDGVLSISLIHGFMAADVPEMGTQCSRSSTATGKGRGAREVTRARDLRPARQDRDADARHRRGPRRRPSLRRAKQRQAGGGRRCLGQSRRRRRRRRHADPAPHARARHRQFRGRDDLGSDRRQFLPRGRRRRDAQLRFGGKAGPDGGAPIDAMVEVRQGAA